MCSFEFMIVSWEPEIFFLFSLSIFTETHPLLRIDCAKIWNKVCDFQGKLGKYFP